MCLSLSDHLPIVLMSVVSSDVLSSMSMLMIRRWVFTYEETCKCIDYVFDWTLVIGRYARVLSSIRMEKDFQERCDSRSRLLSVGHPLWIDIISCCSRQGHNELDEPMFTQPLMYQKVIEWKRKRKLIDLLTDQSNETSAWHLSEAHNPRRSGQWTICKGTE